MGENVLLDAGRPMSYNATAGRDAKPDLGV